MPNKRTVLYFAIEPELRNRCKAAAALQGKTLKQWAIEAMSEKLERELPMYHPPEHTQIQPARGSLKDFLELAEELWPLIDKGTVGKMDAAKDINAMREERLKRIAG